MEVIETLSVPVIVTVVYAMMELFKSAFGTEHIGKFIPLIAVAFGAVLGFCAFYLYPGIIPADNAFAAIFIGAASGWAATGANQTYKKLKDNGEAGGKSDE